MQEDPLKNYTRIEKKQEQITIKKQPWKDTVIIVSDSPASQNLMATETVKRGFTVAIPKNYKNTETYKVNKIKPFAIIGVDNKSKKLGVPFTPQQKNHSFNPGGVSTEELAKSFVDDGNWPVLTTFGLLYGAD
jgi:hypothetical protein